MPKTNLEKLPSRIRYYILEWRDSNMDTYLVKYKGLRLNDLTNEQLRGLFEYATKEDNKLINNNT